MAWYVFALVDRLPSGSAGRGLSGPLSVRRVPGAIAIVERRADVPPVAFGTLKKHEAVIARLARRVPAILPVRFGTLLETEELEEALAERDEEIAEAFDLVRDRVQFTWRLATAKAGSPGPAPPAGEPGVAPVSGVEYLRRAARGAGVAPPAAFRALRDRIMPLTVRQRYQPGSTNRREALYHLVDRTLVPRYTAASAEIGITSPALIVTGPFAPYAFTPEIL